MAICFVVATLAILASFGTIDCAVLHEMPKIDLKVLDLPYPILQDLRTESHFTEEWRKLYDENQLENQPKWTPSEEQPQDASYEVREYAPAWWVTSFVPCLNQSVASSFGYLKLYLYMNRANNMHEEYNLTYPILNKVDMEPYSSQKDDDKERNRCPDRYSVNFYLPYESDDYFVDDAPPKGADETITTSESDVQRRYVFTYDDQFTAESLENCNDRAVEYGRRLKSDGKSIDEYSYYCAMYEPDQEGRVRFEVWFDDTVNN